ncbi:CBO0543 family protein [Aneurinibacillus tyrosinisolvens]|uniref:CBO0543 family protein n=1 Tax=Aneurinibacillus tyrosinisolvens TaxID=1443435 RepID=UPI002714B9FB|nr:CBO0543 family protein [Aneurinibacillus tyrosinisolvens]
MFGDWKNWRRYYPTILFFITGDLTYNFVTSFLNYPLWRYHGAIPPNHLLINLLIDFVAYPATILIYLKYAVRGWKQFAFHYFLWVFLYSIIEFINLNLGLISHHHGWNIWASILNNLIMFLTLRIHYSYPLLGWLIFFILKIAIIFIFAIPVLSK